MKTLRFIFLFATLFLFLQAGSFAQKLPNIHILATGGTIAGTGTSTTGSSYRAGQVAINELISAVPELKEIANITGEQIVKIGSQDMSDEVWLKLAHYLNELLQRKEVDGVVITHGTDTMEETAFFLNLTVKSNKPVVLVGAMRPATSLSADGPLNLYNAVVTAGASESVGRGVMIVMNGSILGAHAATKMNTINVQAFQAPNSGALGYVFNGKVHYNQSTDKLHTLQSVFDVTHLDKLPKVGIVYSYSNVEPEALDALITNSYQGIVHAGVGNGNIHKNLFDKLVNASKQGILVVRSSRVPTGPTTLDAEVDDAKYGFVASQELNPQKARILLMLALTKTKDPQVIQNYFNAYPNNIFLTIIFAGIKYLSSLFGCVDNYFPTIVAGVISTDAAIVFTVMTVWKLTHSRKVTFLSIIICTVFLGFNPWIIIPYSDTYVLPFLSAVLYFYCSMKDEKKGYASWIGIVIAASLGIKIKPTVVIALLAIVLAEIFFLRKCQIKEIAAKCLIVAGGTIIVLGLINSLSDAVYDQRNGDAQMTWQHYLMMGANEETYGSYFGVDRERSWGISDPEKRKEMQIEVWRQRISEKGIWGTIKFYMQKLIIANDDGSFAWGWEGNFFGEYRGLHSEFAQKLQSFYYAQDNKMIYNILQSIWVSIQILVCFFAIFFDNRNKRALFIAMTLTGINLFLMIFEVRARYLFMFVPFYITAAMLGLFYMQEKVKMIKDRKCHLQ